MEFKRMTVNQWVKERKDAKETARRARLGAAAATSTTAASTKAPTVAKPANSKTPANVATIPKAPPPPIVTGLPPDQEVVLLQTHFITPADKLSNHGYVPTIPTDADIKKARDAEEVSKGWEQCERCTRRFQVFPGRREKDGALTSGDTCQYHPGRLNHVTQVFGCCSASASDGSPGCETASSHVFKANDAKRLASLWNFVKTPANPDPNVPVDRAVCFDCEMAYTVYGVEVVRLTATSWPSGDLLLDILVRPHGTVIDFNSRFSGVFPEDFAMSIPYTPEAAEAAKKNKPAAVPEKEEGKPASRPPMLMASSPKEARDLFHKLIRPETVLIGHALENDLKAMRMVHARISDTALLYPHPKGLPIRYSLRVLAKEHLDRVVQAGGPLAGHDSAEDARVAGDLVRLKIKNKWDDLRRRQNWKLVDGVMVRDV
ncbi:RNA exonuclease 3 [Sporothrix stenoceras]|uniref:RNA exonuclease 3 n=1 Tax=Sporothrix stenoceras TaxID=5173 RepID=A0ABR3ZRC5_9PEZI